ncbi:MAG: hypothetical protein WBX14_02400, partial [Candidatus Udaeobacter sp.]
SMAHGKRSRQKVRDGEDTIANMRAACAPRNSLHSSDRNDGSGFDNRRLGLVGDQLAQERNQRDEHNTDREAARAELGEEL